MYSSGVRFMIVAFKVVLRGAQSFSSCSKK
jgi:hypothetical protein